ncbi:MAG: tyrosine-type recombinase/integrase [Candidatus Bathyarchaeota archaeon]
MPKQAFLEEWANKEESIQNMIDQILYVKKGSKKTVKVYTQCVHDFCMFNKEESADKLLKKYKQLDERAVRHHIFNYIKARSKTLAGKTLKSNLSGVKRWFRANEYSIKWDLIETPPALPVQDDRSPTREELNKVLTGHKISLRDKAFIELAVSTGLRIGTLLTLKLGDCVFDVDQLLIEVDDYYLGKTTPEERLRIKSIAMIKVRMEPGRKLRGKNGFFTFVTSEAKQMLQRYLDWRKSVGEQLTPDSILIGKEQPNHSNEHCSVVPMSRHWRRTLIRNGLMPNGSKWHPLHFHTLRKFHTTMTATVRSYPPIWRGQKQGEYLDASYFRPSLVMHVKAFLQVENKLQLESNKNIQRLRIEAEEQKNEVSQLKKVIEMQNQRLNGLASGMELSSSQLKKIIELVKEELRKEKASS